MRIPLSVLALALTVLAGCATDDDSTTTTGSRKPLKVQHAMGETRVPFRSERPVTLDPSALETALALGVEPVGSATADGTFPPYLRGRVPDVEALGPVRDPDLRAVRRLDPDVIIGNERYQRRLYRRLEPLAPTVMSGVPLSEWKSDVRFFGEALGRGDQAEELLKDYDRRAARARDRVRGMSGREALDALPRRLARSLSPGFLAEVFRDAGLRPPATTGQGGSGGILAAREVLDALVRARGG